MAIAFVQSATLRVGPGVTATPTFASPVGSTSLLVVVGSGRGTNDITDPGGWALIDDVDNDDGSGSYGDHGRTKMWARTGSPGETSLGNWAHINETAYTIVEFSGVDDPTPLTSTAKNRQASGSAHIALSGMVAAGAAVAVAVFSRATYTTGFTPDAGYTELSDQNAGDGGLSGHGPNQTLVYKIDTGVTFTAGTTDSSAERWCAIGALFAGFIDPAEPGTGVDFDDDGFGTGDELGPYVMSYTITRGASAEIIGAASVGSCTIELKNTGDIFNPLNTGGAYYGKLRDGLPLWLGVNSDGAWSGSDPRGLFGGRTKDWTPNTVAGAGDAAPTVTLTGEDALAWYRRAPARVADDIGRSQAELRLALLTAGGESRYDLAHEIRRLPLSSFDGDLLTGLEAINQSNGTRHFVKPQNDRTDWYRYTTRDRQWRLDATTDGALDAGSDHVTGADGWTLSADTVTNQQKATVTPVYFTPSSMVVWHAPTLPFTFSGTKVMWLEFDDYVDAPDPDINYTGTAPGVTLTPFGRTAKLTLTSTGTTTVTDLIVHGRLARRALDESYVADDTASQAGSRGVRAGGDISGAFVGSLASARGICDHVVWRYADPQLRPTVTVMNWLPDQFEIDLYDVIAVTVAELSMVAELFEVVGLTHSSSFAPSATAHLHTTTYVLQQCRVQADPGWFVLDTSELDSAAILGY